jgi:hypothetical protein
MPISTIQRGVQEGKSMKDTQYKTEIQKIKLLKQLITGLLEFEQTWNNAVSKLEAENKAA